MKILILLLLPMLVMANDINITPDFNFESNVLSVPVVTYPPNNAASAKLKLNFEDGTFAVEQLNDFDCTMQQTHFSPYPTNDNFNPCEYR